VNRWGKGDPKPLFGVYLFAQGMDRELAWLGHALRLASETRRGKPKHALKTPATPLLS
jgi:hypothetical protein